MAKAADAAANACLLFEVARVFWHLNWSYAPPLPDRSQRKDWLIWAQLFGTCQECHTWHIHISKTAYYMWHANCPFLCYHKLVIDTIRVQPDEAVAKMYPEVPLPDKVKVLEPDVASKYSGGLLNSLKLKKDWPG